ncbi:transglutaminase-like domain-containing protein [Microvirga alba]|uniref:Transglutaminase family protein n=1 Tax=Microvirga alba TaxID=2791025 RepID=A0A931BL81_9HYPH|nr:transglutaminase family protein [Microvirga alba]MBF9232961.1 transglutaminase family protein [Microvirga alba]
MSSTEIRLLLSPAEYVDSDHPAIRSYASEATAGIASAAGKARRLYDVVRDSIRYDPYVDYTDREVFRASSVLQAGAGYCVGKAALYAALCRAVGLPARVGLADVRNHLATPRLIEAVGTDVFAFHGYVEVQLEGRWVKVTPTFNSSLCAKLGVAPLDFDGTGDALLQAYDGEGRRFMEYLLDHGSFFDVPTKFLMAEMVRLYPNLSQPGGLRGNMEAEASRP